MEKYFVIRVKFLPDGTIKKSEVMDYDSRIEALAKFHSNLAADMADDTLAGSVCTVINAHGGQEAREYWQREVEDLNHENDTN